jgi:hypothetical protein
MLSSNRRAAVLSTLVAALAASCVDPQGRLNEFVNNTRGPDAGATVDAGAGKLYDVSGTFLVAIKIFFAPNKPVQLLSTQTLHMNGDGTGTIDFHIVYLSKTDRSQLPNPIDVTGVAVNKNGDFTLTKDLILIPQAANPVGIDATIQNVQFIGNTRSADFMCGVVHGHIVEANMDLEAGEPGNPTTWGGVRAASASSLPDPINGCSGAPGLADAG